MCLHKVTFRSSKFGVSVTDSINLCYSILMDIHLSVLTVIHNIVFNIEMSLACLALLAYSILDVVDVEA